MPVNRLSRLLPLLWLPVVLASSSGCEKCMTHLECGPSKRCLADPITLEKSCQAPCSSDGDCNMFGVVCASGACEKGPPVITLDQPASDMSLAEGADTGPIRGTVGFWGAAARLRATVRQVASTSSCYTGVWDFPWVRTIQNTYPEEYAEEVFELDPLPVMPGEVALTVQLVAGTEMAVATRKITSPACSTCPSVTITTPTSGTVLDPTTLVLPDLAGRVSVANATCARWTLTSQGGEVAQGLLRVAQGAFGPYPLPVFAGTNRLRVEVGSEPVGSCEVTVNAFERASVSLRAQLIWDSEGDMDLHLVRPAGTYWTANDCHYANCKGGLQWGVSNTYLDVDNTSAFGPENIRLDVLENGTYGVLVNPFGGTSTVTVRVYAGTTLAGAVGPCRLEGDKDLVVGTFGANGFETLNKLVLKRAITTAPESWGSGTEPFGAGVASEVCPPAQEAKCDDPPPP